MARNSCRSRRKYPSRPRSIPIPSPKPIRPSTTSPMAALKAPPSSPSLRDHRFLASPHNDGLACHRNERSAPSAFPYMNKRTLIAAVAAGGLTLGAAAVGVAYFVVFAGNSPQKLALSSPTPTASGSPTASASAGAGAGTWTIGSGSVAGYRVREQLASLSA